MQVIVLGDSHSLYSFAGVAEAKIFWRGAVTMHRAARDGIRPLVPGNCKPAKCDLMVLSFGEIDCRAHIKIQALRNGTTTREEVDALCRRFDEAVVTFQSTCPARVCTASIVPFNPDHLETDRYESVEACHRDAKLIRRRMNENLSAMQAPFIDFHEDFAQSDGSIVPSMSDGNFHIDSRCSAPVIAALSKATGAAFTSRCPPWPNPKSLVELPHISTAAWLYGHLKNVGGALRRWTRPLRRQERAGKKRRTVR